MRKSNNRTGRTVVKSLNNLLDLSRVFGPNTHTKDEYDLVQGCLFATDAVAETVFNQAFVLPDWQLTDGLVRAAAEINRSLAGRVLRAYGVL